MSDQTITEKLTQCYGGCGQVIPYLTTRKVCCTPCREARRRESMRLVSERMRRKNGVEPVKGTMFVCERCGCQGVRDGVKRKFCAPCAREYALERARIRSKRVLSTEAGRKYQNEWSRKKLATDPKLKVSSHMKVMIHRGIGSSKAGRSWREFVPYTLKELMTHLERQFMSGMTWDNKGEWHIDHIRPISSFEFSGPEDQGFKDAWALTNLRPLWAKDNIRKNATRTHLL